MGNHGFRYLLYDIATGIVSWHRLTSFKKLRLTKNVQPYGPCEIIEKSLRQKKNLDSTISLVWSKMQISCISRGGQPRPIAINDETNGVSNVW